MRSAFLAYCSITIVILSLGGCGEYPVEFEQIGASCSREAATLCEHPDGDDEAGPCLLDIPGGMCSYDCSGDEGVCPEGFLCADISEGRYCLEACDGDGGCREGTVCVLGACRGPNGAEEPCEEEGDCASGLQCILERCLPPRPSGEACEEDDDCASGLQCILEQCHPPRPFGEECEEDDDCESDLCHEDLCSQECGRQSDCPGDASCLFRYDEPNLCVDLQIGERCDRDRDCPSDVCFDGECTVECHDEWDCFAGLDCIDTGDGVPICVEYDPPEIEEGEYGENCTFNDCAGGFDCMARTEDRENDPYAYCTKGCDTDLDCPASMTCRRTQMFDEEDWESRCVPREYCERCAHDGQCGSADELCVSNDPDRDPGRYCSRSCDPDRPITSCPTDSTCHEVFWCGLERSWVPDCDWCSDEDECEAPEEGPRYQCFHDWGACSGTGDREEFCTPCFVDDDCPSGGECAYDAYTANTYCATRCEKEGEEWVCPPEHYCVESGRAPNYDHRCHPRQGSCSFPSGGLTACEPCDSFGDCVSGYCIPDDTGFQYCFVDCAADPGSCPPYTQCSDFVDDRGDVVARLCAPVPALGLCTQVNACLEDCPDGPESCNSHARTYCL